MKATMKLLPLVLSLVACGSTETSVTTSNSTELTHAALGTSPIKLTEARKQALAKAYVALDAKELSTGNEMASHFGSDELFAVVALSEVLTNARMARPISILVPGGTSAAPRNPNRSDEFYVSFDSQTTEQMPTVFGPFPLFGQEGSTCGGFAGLTCVDGLACNLASQTPDAAGTCEATN